MEKVTIILPVHKSFHNLTENEIQSLQQLNNVLREFPLCIIVSSNFPTDDYIKFFSHQKVFVERFKEDQFKTIRSYNQLCLSTDFYKRFLCYRYMLIYQLDAYVFKNDLEAWIQQGCDYIGAPFHKNNREPYDEKKWTVGNGGFSLRSVRSCYEVLKRVEFYYLAVKLLNKLRCKRPITKALIKLGLINLSIIENIKLNRYNEDYVFGVLSKQVLKHFQVAPIHTALKFSFEAHPALLYKINNNELPFGCHGWDKYEPEFWKNFIDISKEIDSRSLISDPEDEVCDSTKAQ